MLSQKRQKKTCALRHRRLQEGGGESASYFPGAQGTLPRGVLHRGQTHTAGVAHAPPRLWCIQETRVIHLCSFLTKALARTTCRFPGPALDQSQGCSYRVGVQGSGGRGWWGYRVGGVQGPSDQTLEGPCRMCHPGGLSLQKPHPPLEVPWMHWTLPGAPEVELVGAALLTQMSTDVSLHEPCLLFPWRGTTLF